jgi:hypothetical protein
MCVRVENVSDLVQILHRDVFEVDVSEATVVFLYLLPKGGISCMIRLSPSLYQIGGWFLSRIASSQMNQHC